MTTATTEQFIEIRYPAWFKPAFDTDKRYIDIWGGRSRGGSHTGTNYFLDLITAPEYFRGYFVRQSFNDIRSSLFQDFKDRINDNDTVDIKDFAIQENEMRIIYKPTGNMIISKGVRKDGNRTAKMKSLAGATHVLIEEADELGEDDFYQMDISLRTVKEGVKLQILRIFNPPHLEHWIWKNDYTLKKCETVDGYFTATPRSDRPVLSLFATYKSNLRNTANTTVELFGHFKKTKPEYYYTVICGLISEGQRGIIFNGWQPCNDEVFNQIDARSILGLDFGVNTGGLVECKFDKSNLYTRELYYGGGTAKDLGILLCSLGITDQLIIADSAEPLKIAKLRNGWSETELLPDELEKYPRMLTGFNMRTVSKKPGSIVSGISMIKDYKCHVTESSVNLWKEYRNYKWALDKNKNPTDYPEDGYNHLIDPKRYIVLEKGRLF